jgi:hypothetical protein
LSFRIWLELGRQGLGIGAFGLETAVEKDDGCYDDGEENDCASYDAGGLGWRGLGGRLVVEL